MIKSQKLERLASMQKLRERKCEGSVGETALQAREKAAQARQLTEEQGAARVQLSSVMQSATFCPDRMLMAAGQLSLADDALERGKAELAEARQGEAEARDDWAEARFRSDDMASQVRQSQRHEQRRREDAALARAMSLRAALQGVQKP